MATRTRAGRRGRGLAQSDANHVNPQPARRGRQVANAALSTTRARLGRGGLLSGDGATALVGRRQTALPAERAGAAEARSKLG